MKRPLKTMVEEIKRHLEHQFSFVNGPRIPVVIYINSRNVNLFITECELVFNVVFNNLQRIEVWLVEQYKSELSIFNQVTLGGEYNYVCNSITKPTLIFTDHYSG